MINKKIHKFAISLIICFIKLYQILISPLIKNNCRYLPTCSQFTIEALNEHGIIKGIYYSFKRILSCHPMGGKGYDPVPKKIKR